MTAATIHDGIQNAVMGFIANLTFARVYYPSGLRTTSSTESEVAVALCHRKSARVEKPRSGCSRLPQVVEEIWTLELRFNGPVDLSAFEEAFNAASLDTEVNGVRFLIDLAEGEFNEPVEQQGTTGTLAVYKIRAHLPGN